MTPLEKVLHTLARAHTHTHVRANTTNRENTSTSNLKLGRTVGALGRMRGQNTFAAVVYKKKENKVTFRGRGHVFAAFPAFAESWRQTGCTLLQATTDEKQDNTNKQTHTHTQSPPTVWLKAFSPERAQQGGSLYRSPRLLKHPPSEITTGRCTKKRERHFELSPHLVSLLQLEKSSPTVKAVGILFMNSLRIFRGFFFFFFFFPCIETSRRDTDAGCVWVQSKSLSNFIIYCGAKLWLMNPIYRRHANNVVIFK